MVIRARVADCEMTLELCSCKHLTYAASYPHRLPRLPAKARLDYPAIKRLGAWLGSFPEVKGLTVLGHAGEGTFLERDEQYKVIEAFRDSTDGRVHIIAGITLEGTQVAAEEAKRAVKAGAKAGLVYPSHGSLRFGYQEGVPQDRYRAIYEASGLPLILFQYPDIPKASYNL
jgi:4-hydroxy-tetrahydrodipicolinate synthase